MSTIKAVHMVGHENGGKFHTDFIATILKSDGAYENKVLTRTLPTRNRQQAIMNSLALQKVCDLLVEQE